MPIIFSPEILCVEGRNKLRELRKEARSVGTEEQALELVKKAAEIKCGMPIQLLGSEAVNIFERHHGLKWRAYIWGGQPEECASEEFISGDADGHFLRTVDWIYRGSNGKDNGRSTNGGFEGNF